MKDLTIKKIIELIITLNDEFWDILQGIKLNEALDITTSKLIEKKIIEMYANRIYGILAMFLYFTDSKTETLNKLNFNNLNIENKLLEKVIKLIQIDADTNRKIAKLIIQADVIPIVKKQYS